MTNFTQRMIGAARLNRATYEEIEADTTATGQAITVVVLASVAAGIGSIAQAGVGGLVLGTVVALIGWYVWALLTYWIGTRLFPEPQTKADMGELLRTIGFSSSPGIIRVLAVIPPLSAVVFLVAGVWMLVAMVVAVRQALDYSGTLRALGVCVVGWIVQALILVVLFSVIGAAG